MKPWIKILIGVVIGFGGGFASGFFTHKKLNDLKFEEVTEEEMAEIEKDILEKEKAKNEEKDSVKNADKPFDVLDLKGETLPDDTDKLRNALQGKKPYIQADRDQKLAYEKLWNATKEYSNEENANELPTEKEMAEKESPVDDEEEFDEEFLEQIEEEAANTGAGFVEPPHVISLADFYNDRPEFDKVTISWYEPDNVWVDEREEIIPDIRSYIGLEVKSLFASNSYDDDPDVRFVRNEKYGSDYEIIRHHRSWRETTGGVN